MHFDKGILYTVKELFIRPGDSVKEFLSDNRSRLVKPVIFIIITSLIHTIISHFFHIEDGYVNYKNTKATSTTLIFKWINDHYGYSNIIMGLFIAFFTKLFFKKYNYNFFEILILLCFVMGIGMLLLALFAALEGIIKVQLMQVSSAIAFIYSSWAIGQFFDKSKKMSYLKAFLAYVFGFITFSISALILGAIIDSLVNH